MRGRGADRAGRPQCRARSGGRHALSHRRASGRRHGRRRRSVRRGRQPRRAAAEHGRARRGADLAGGVRPGAQQVVDRLRVPGPAPAQEPGRAGAGVSAAVRQRERAQARIPGRNAEVQPAAPRAAPAARPSQLRSAGSAPARHAAWPALRDRLGRPRRHQPGDRRRLLLGGLAGHRPARGWALRAAPLLARGWVDAQLVRLGVIVAVLGTDQPRQPVQRALVPLAGRRSSRAVPAAAHLASIRLVAAASPENVIMPEAQHGNRQILLARRPKGAPVPEDFAFEDGPVPEPRDGEALVRTIWLSLDPYMRGRMSDAPSYARRWRWATSWKASAWAGSRPAVPRAWRRATMSAGAAAGRAGSLAGGPADPARSAGGAAEHIAGRARHAGTDGLRRAADDRATGGRRDGRRRVGQRCGRRDRGPARQARRLPGGGRGRWGGQVPLRRGRAGLRPLPRPVSAGPRRPSARGVPERGRCLCRAGRWRPVLGRAAAAEPPRPDSGDRRHRLVQSGASAGGARPHAAIDARRADPAAPHRGIPGARPCRAGARIPPDGGAPGPVGAAYASGRTWSKAWTMRRRP